MPITLIANDDKRVEFTPAEIVHVKMATDILGDAPTEGEVDVPAVAGATLEKVKNFLTLRVAGPMGEIKKPLRDKTDLTKSGLTEPFAAWATALSSDDAFELIRAGDFLKVEDLTNIAAARIAQVYLQYTGPQKDAIFLPPGQEKFTLDFDKQLRAQFPWADKEPEYEAEILKAANDALRAAGATVDDDEDEDEEDDE